MYETRSLIKRLDVEVTEARNSQSRIRRESTMEDTWNLFRSLGKLGHRTPWEVGCRAHWWPFEDTDGLCGRVRCSVCAPAITAAFAVCEKTGAIEKHRCIQSIMGDGFCNYCIIDYLQ